MNAFPPVFLSASVPRPERDARFYGTADAVAIREAIRALAAFVLPRARLVWGGHPAITPLIREVALATDFDVRDHVLLYRSEWFGKVEEGPEQVVTIPAAVNREESLRSLRTSLITEHRYVAGLFVGGMEGVLKEADLFLEHHPTAPFLPVASTGAAARELYNRYAESHLLAPELATQLSYGSLFRRFIPLDDSP